MGAMLLAFVTVVLVAGVDLLSDWQEGISLTHALSEGIVVIVALGGSGVAAGRLVRLVRGSRAMSEELSVLTEDLKTSRAEAQRWRAEVKQIMEGLGAAIDRQFERWQLSPAEKEVGLLLLKGLSHREVAELRSVTEATTRQQARSLYGKAGLSGRNDLSAFFLEDLMLPLGNE